MSFLRQFFAIQPVQAAPAGGTDRLKRALGPWALTAIGLGATIGSGVFVFTGQVAAQHAGPAVTISLLIAATPGMAPMPLHIRTKLRTQLIWPR